jgi:hypothetical protein
MAAELTTDQIPFHLSCMGLIRDARRHAGTPGVADRSKMLLPPGGSEYRIDRVRFRFQYPSGHNAIQQCTALPGGMSGAPACGQVSGCLWHDGRTARGDKLATSALLLARPLMLAAPPGIGTRVDSGVECIGRNVSHAGQLCNHRRRGRGGQHAVGGCMSCSCTCNVLLHR